MPFTLFYLGMVVAVAFFGTLKDNRKEKIANNNVYEIKTDSLKTDSLKNNLKWKQK